MNVEGVNGRVEYIYVAARDRALFFRYRDGTPPSPSRKTENHGGQPQPQGQGRPSAQQPGPAASFNV